MRRVVGVLLLLCLLMVGCQRSGISKEPTPYMVMGTVAGKYEISSYLMADHPDVKACLTLVEQFMQIYLNQDYQHLTLDTEARPLVTTTTIGDPLSGYVASYLDSQVSVALRDLSTHGITFTRDMQGRLSTAVVQMEAAVCYSHASSSWLLSRNAELGKDYSAAFDVQLSNDEDGWRVRLISESQAGA